jgi:hypothetical protein
VRNIRAKVPSPRSTVAVVVPEPETREVAAYTAASLVRRRGRSWSGSSSLDDAGSRLVAKRWAIATGSGSRCSWAPCGCSARFAADPTDVPGAVCVYVAEQVGAACASWLSCYLDRRKTRFEYVAEITTTYGYREFAVAEAEFVQWLNDRAWSRRGRGGEAERCRKRGKRRVGCGGETRLAVPRQVAERFQRAPAGLLGLPSAMLHRPFRSALLVSCDVELPGRFEQPAGLLARWLDAPMHYPLLSRRGHRPVVGARSVRHDQRR